MLNRYCRRRLATASAFLLAVVLGMNATPVFGEAIVNLAQAKKLFVDQFSEGDEAAQLRQSLIRRIDKSGRFQVVDAAEKAEAILKPSGEIWIKGYLAINPRSPSNNRQAAYSGYLSVEVVSKDGEP